ncbi:MAG TPA: hypothetical protein VKV04_04110 [Verrucomicrobiae bacterium]|nr:hypothetical protein [Verrucomicrobiae bacterium]
MKHEVIGSEKRTRPDVSPVAQSCTLPYRRVALCRASVLLLLVTLLLGLCGCASTPLVSPRPFNFQTDTFSFPNDLIWEYHYDANGKWVHNRREPQPDYTHHCFVVARSARQFFENARFDTNQPIATEAEYRHLIRHVVSIDPRHALAESNKIVIPGYANLREFSTAQERLLKSECGGPWQSYTQRGHWRMIFFFSRASQERTVKRLLADLKDNRPPVVHLTTFPSLSINHAILLFGAKETENEILFSVYDPNKPDSPKVLTYNRATRTFSFASNDYWPGGKLNVYEVYRSWDY